MIRLDYGQISAKGKNLTQISPIHMIRNCIHKNYICIKVYTMRHYINIFQTIPLMLFIKYFEKSVECFLITPKTVPDDIQIFISSCDIKGHDLDKVKHKKSWLMYIDANLVKTLFAFLEWLEILNSVKCGSANFIYHPLFK